MPCIQEGVKIIDLIGGAKRNRTADLLNAIQALSQLSYGPTGNGGRINRVGRACKGWNREAVVIRSDLMPG